MEKFNHMELQKLSNLQRYQEGHCFEV